MRRKTSVNGRSWGRRLLEIGVEVAIAVGLVVGIILYAEYGPKKAPFDFKWVPFGINTAIVFGYALKTTRTLWHKPKLWVVMSTLLLAHLLLGWLVLRGVERVPLIWYVPVVMVEVSAVLRLIELSFSAVELEECAPSGKH